MEVNLLDLGTFHRCRQDSSNGFLIVKIHQRAAEVNNTARMELAIVLLIIVATIHAINSVKILGVFHMPAYSHFQLGDKLLKELAARGHEVTIVTPYKEKESTENFKTIELNGIIEEVESRFTFSDY